MEANSLFPLTSIPQTCPDEAALAALQKHVNKSTEDASSSKSKVLLRFQPVSGGNTPVLKQNVFKLAAGSPFQVCSYKEFEEETGNEGGRSAGACFWLHNII
jgi:hypothetical protein